MRQKSETPKTTPDQVVKDIRRATRKHHSAEEKIRIVLEGLRGEYSIAVMPHNIIQQMRQILSSITQPSVSDYLTTDSPARRLPGNHRGQLGPQGPSGDRLYLVGNKLA